MDVRRRNIEKSEDEFAEDNSLFKKIKKIDSFPKLPHECVNYTAGGGGASIIAFLIILTLVGAEIASYLNPKVDFQYSVDKLLESELPINIDMTVATKCSEVSIDVFDVNGGLIVSSEHVSAIDSRFALSSRRNDRFQAKKTRLSYLRQQHYALHQLFWMSQTNSDDYNLHPQHPVREDQVPVEIADACRFVGTFMAKKSQGNMHVTTGKALSLSSNIHIHLSPLGSDGKRNFSHRIHHLSFGEPLEHYIHPLDAEEVISDDPSLMYQYFIEVVPTTFTTRLRTINTYQYAVTEQARTINHVNQSQGVPGVFFRYDVFPVRVEVDAAGETSLLKLLLRLSAIAGGVFATADLLCLLISGISDRTLRHRHHHTDGPLMPEPES